MRSSIKNYSVKMLLIAMTLFMAFSNAEASPPTPDSLYINVTPWNSYSYMQFSFQIPGYNEFNGKLKIFGYDNNGFTINFEIDDSVYYNRNMFNAELLVPLTQLPPGKYKFYITLEENGEESGESNHIDVEILGQNDISYNSNFPREAEVGDSVIFNLNGATPNRDTLEYILMEGPDDLYLNSENGYIIWMPTEAGTYKIKIKIQLKNDASNYKIVEWTIIIRDAATYVRITNRPPSSAYLDEEYSFTMTAITNSNDDNIVFSLDQAPDGMTINAETGLISWQPEEMGTYNIVVRAGLENDSEIFDRASQRINVHKCKEKSAILVNVVDEDGNPVQSGLIEIYHAEYYDEDSLQLVIQKPINNGWMIIAPIDAGDYYLYINGMNRDFESEWYEDSEDFDGAKIVRVDCDDSLYFTVVVKKIDPIKNYNITGTVTREYNEEPLDSARIIFFGRKIGGVETKEWSTMTWNGDYVISLPEDYEYVAYCSEVYAPGLDRPLMPQYYQRVDDPTEATILRFNGQDIDYIDFALEVRLDYDNYIYGGVFDENLSALANVNVIAYLVEASPWNQDKLYIGRSVISSSDGTFTFENLVPGTYVLFAYQRRSPIVPGYYKENELSVNSWLDATLIYVPEEGVAGNFVMRMDINEGMFDGDGRIEGKVVRLDGKMKSGDIPLTDEAIPGAIIFTYDDMGVEAAYSNSEHDGAYKVEGMNKGSYNLFIDKVGYKPVETEIELESEDAVVESNHGMEVKTITSVEDELEETATVIAYPNPVVNNLKIDYKGVNGQAILMVSDILGKVVYMNKFDAISGMNTIEINVAELPAGKYFVKLINNSGRLHTSFEIIR